MDFQNYLFFSFFDVPDIVAHELLKWGAPICAGKGYDELFFRLVVLKILILTVLRLVVLKILTYFEAGVVLFLNFGSF